MKAKVLDLAKLRVGAKILDIEVKSNASAADLERKIQRELAKDPTYASFGCKACGRDIIDVIPICPFCTAEFKPITHGVVEEGEEPAAQFVSPLAKQVKQQTQQPEGAEEGVPVAAKKQKAPEFVADDFDEIDDDDGWGDEVEWDDDVVFEEEPEDEPEPPPPPPLPKPKKKPAAVKKKAAKKKAAKKRTSRKKSPKERNKERIEEERENKRRQVAEELPYPTADLQEFSRATLAMVAGVLGIYHPLKLGKNANIIKAIVQAQKEQFGT